MSSYQWNHLLFPAGKFNETEFEDFWITTEDSGGGCCRSLCQSAQYLQSPVMFPPLVKFISQQWRSSIVDAALSRWVLVS